MKVRKPKKQKTSPMFSCDCLFGQPQQKKVKNEKE